ncbi:unnamed protein product [Hapterophycus canaliculatus]
MNTFDKLPDRSGDTGILEKFVRRQSGVDKIFAEALLKSVKYIPRLELVEKVEELSHVLSEALGKTPDARFYVLFTDEVSKHFADVLVASNNSLTTNFMGFLDVRTQVQDDLEPSVTHYVYTVEKMFGDSRSMMCGKVEEKMKQIAGSKRKRDGPPITLHAAPLFASMETMTRMDRFTITSEGIFKLLWYTVDTPTTGLAECISDAFAQNPGLSLAKALDSLERLAKIYSWVPEIEINYPLLFSDISDSEVGTVEHFIDLATASFG